MTREQIMAMPAGRELDALVAERVMGWKVTHTVDDDGEDLWTLRDEHRQFVDCDRISGQRCQFERIPHYSGDIAAARQVEDAIAERDLQAKYARILLEIERPDFKTLHDVCEDDFWAVASALPDARCRAALIATG